MRHITAEGGAHHHGQAVKGCRLEAAKGAVDAEIGKSACENVISVYTIPAFTISQESERRLSPGESMVAEAGRTLSIAINMPAARNTRCFLRINNSFPMANRMLPWYKIEYI